MKKILLLSSFLFLQQNLFAQKSLVKILNASHMSWSGGMEGNEGENFYLEVEVPKTLVPDTFWNNGFAIPVLMKTDANQSGNCQIIKKGSKVIYSLSLELNPRLPKKIIDANMDGKPDEQLPEPASPCKYALSFKSQDSICIEEITELPSPLYPEMEK